MCLKILPISVACLALLSSVANGEPLKVLSAPNLLRIGATENIFVECQECSGADLDVEILVKNFPTQTRELNSTTVTLTQKNKFQAFGEIKIPAEEFKDDPELKQRVSLEAKFSDGTVLKKVVLVSFKSGYIFIQTDKPLYTPNSRVHYRVFGVTPGLKPVGGEDDQASIININIVTPDDIVLSMDPVSLKSGIHSGLYVLPEIVSNGMWKVVATFQNNKQHNYSAEFEVKEYVLPSFEVKITADKNYFYVNDVKLTVDIKATYLFGKEVEGSAYVVFGIFDPNKEKHSFPGSIQRVLVANGKAQATLERTQIQETFADIEKLVKSSIYVAVTVLTESGSELVEAEKQGIHIVRSPYTIQLKNTPQYFKPTMFFEVVVYVEYPDGSPASGVPLLVDPGEIEVTTTKTGFARVPINPSGSPPQLIITARTADPRVSNDRQTSASLTALPYTSSINSYLHIGVGSSEVRLKDNLQITLSLNAPLSTRDITYLIQSRGQLVKYGRFRTELTRIAMTLPVTKEMLPSFRIIAYYRDRAEVVSDSIWVDVIDTCMGSLKLESSRAAPSRPRDTFRYTITGDPGATVGLVAVDQGVYALNNKHRLTQKKVWDVVEKADTGCTPGGGKNSMKVFYDAGLLFQSNLIGTEDRQVFKCEVSTTRKKRAPASLDVRTTLLSEYKDSLLRQCCLDGMAETPLSYSCERRSEYISDGTACADAFLKCCQELTKLRTESKAEALYSARSEERNIVFKESGQIDTRTEFPESWLWVDYKLPLCPDGINCETTSLEKTTPLKDSITTWHLTGISLSPTHGICVDDTLKIIVQKDFFIDLRLPYSAVRGEQIEIKAILHNYLLDDITVLVYLKELTDVCSSASKRKEYTQIVKVAAQSTRSVPFIIIPMKPGKFPIEVKAAVGDRQIDDGIQKHLLVVPDGIKKKVQVNLNLKVGKSQSKQVEIITNPIDVAYIVPKTPQTSQIYVTGGSQMNVLVEKVLSGSSMASLIQQPSGCGEQNMIRMTLPVIAATYLDKTKQWDIVGFSQRDKALEYIKIGYQNELAYRKPDGAFATYPHVSGLSWLTSYVAKVFAMSYNLIDLDINIICGAIKWVILNSQKPDGSFLEIGKVSSSSMMGNVRGLDSDASMTAFSLIAIQEARPICNDIVNSIPGSVNKAVEYLEKRLPSLTNPYAVAMVSYALANENKFNKEILYNFVSRDSNYWQVPSGHLFTLEATAYALLALVKAKEFEDAAPIVRWLNTQRSASGGFQSTQSTIMVYQALAEYWTNAKEQQYEMDVEVQVAGRSSSDSYRVNNENAFQTRTTKFKGLNKEVTVTATGSGEATVSVVSLYYATATNNSTKDCEKFELNVTLSQGQDVDDLNVHLLKIEILYKDMNKDAGMTILDIGLLTGYTPDIADLDQLSKRKDRSISKYEMDKLLSDKGSLILYLDKVSHTHPEEVAFKIRQTMKVGVLQPATVSVYEYYNEKPCLKFYHPAREGGQLLQLCRGDVCKCAEEECSMQKKGEIDNIDRNEKACDAEAKIDYVYKVNLDSYDDHKTTDFYKMRIQQVIKEGSYDKSPVGKQRTFIGYSHCRESIGLRLGKSYLIMGTFEDTEKTGAEYRYLLGEKTWIEHWPTESECQTEDYADTCQGLEELIFSFGFDGCSD